MGIRESLLNTITSVGSSDFVRIVTSAGASSKATLQNVIKSFETGLGAKTSLTTSDYIRVVGSDNNPYKQSVSDVKSTMGVTTLENNMGSTLTSGTDLNTLTLSANERKIKIYHGQDITAMVNRPSAVSNAWPFCLELIPIGTGATYTKQVLHIYGTTGIPDNTYVRTQTYSGGTVWTNWVQLPTRAEIDALNSNTTKHDITTYVDLSSYTSTWYTFPTDGYITASCGSASNSIAVGRVGGSSLNVTFSIGGYGNGTYGSWTTFVRAGMKAQAVRLENGGTFFFRPLS